MKIINTGNVIKKGFICAITILLLASTAVFPVSAEGSSAEVSLSISRSILNIGKTFTVSLKVVPNGNKSITSFDAKIKYDTANIELIKEGDYPKITKPSGVPSSFKVEGTVTGSDITILGVDETLAMNAPIKTNGKETMLVTFSFKVKDNATVGSTASFSILDCTLNELAIPIPLTIISPKTAPVAARLDTNANLSEIKTDIGSLTPAFSKTVTSYKIETPMDSTSISVTAKQESALAKIAIAGGKTLAFGDNKVTITVTAQDPDVVKVYTITVHRPSPAVSPVEESMSSEASESMESSESVSSEDSFEISSSESASSSSNVDPVQASLQFWKIIAYIFIGLFLVTAGVLAWFIIEKENENEKIVKIRRLK